MKYQHENSIIQSFVPPVMRMARQAFGGTLKVAEKSHAGDVVTTLDKQVDRFLVTRLRRAFDYPVISEESSPLNETSNAEMHWIIDPICGTSNLARGIKYFCTNIALVERGKTTAAWVIDHSRGEVIWSAGGGEVRRGRALLPHLSGKRKHWHIDIDWGYWFHLPRTTRTRFADFAHEFWLRDDGSAYTTSSSLSFAYVATGQFDAAVVINVYPWDIVASAFLIEQNGGIVTNFDGSPWTIHSKSVVMAGDKGLHQTLLKLLKKNKLSRIA